MEMGLLWGTLALMLVGAGVIIADELHKSWSEYKVILLFLENGEDVSEAVLRRLCSRTRCCKGAVRVLVVDNYSEDATVPIVSRMAEMFSEIVLVTRNGKQEISPNQLKTLLQNVMAVFDLRDAPGLWVSP